MNRLLVAMVLVCAVFFGLYAPASAREYSHGRTVLFHDVTIAPGDVVNGDLNVLFGNATIAGTIHGDLNVVGGTYQTLPGAEIDGEIHSAAGDSLSALAPWVLWRTGMYPFARQGRHLWWNLASSIVVLLVFLIFPMRVRLALERVEKHPGLSAAVGTLALVAVLPIAVLLVLSIIGIPLVILELAAVFVGIWIGKGAISLLVGRRLYELISPNSTPSPLGALILGLVVVSAAEIVPVVGWAVTALVYLVGFGATILAFAREGYLRSMYARTPFGGGPPFGGPPMNRPA
jgi:hypothetical protein